MITGLTHSRPATRGRRQGRLDARRIALRGPPVAPVVLEVQCGSGTAAGRGGCHPRPGGEDDDGRPPGLAVGREDWAACCSKIV